MSVLNVGDILNTPDRALAEQLETIVSNLQETLDKAAGVNVHFNLTLKADGGNAVHSATNVGWADTMMLLASRLKHLETVHGSDALKELQKGPKGGILRPGSTAKRVN